VAGHDAAIGRRFFPVFQGDSMFCGWKSVAAIGVLAGIVAGCGGKGYQDERPPVDQVNSGGGLQGYDVRSASDQMAADLLALPELNASRNQWTIVVDRMEDSTIDKTFTRNYDIFLERLKVKLFQNGHGRVQLIENKAKFHDLRNKELESGAPDTFGQAGGDTAAPPAAVQPDFSLYGKALDLPNRDNNYYMLEFSLTDLHRRTIVWGKQYEVTIKR
jgi:Peptidoglycan-synthase activator LpoB